MSDTKKEFVRKIALSYLGILIIAGLLSLILRFDFGANLFFLGFLVAGIGAFLGGSLSPRIGNSARNSLDTYSNRPNEELSKQISYKLAHALPSYAIENVMMFAGLAALLTSLPFLIEIMFGK